MLQRRERRAVLAARLARGGRALGQRDGAAEERRWLSGHAERAGLSLDRVDIPDPGSHPIDCSKLDDIEVSPFWIETFEADPNVPDGVGVGEAWSAYDDESYGSYRVPGDAGLVSWALRALPGEMGPRRRSAQQRSEL